MAASISGYGAVMKYLYLLLFPLFAFGQITVTPISHYPTTSLKPQLQLISQDTPNTPVVYKKFTAGSLRSWIDSSAMDSAGCFSKVNCDSTGTGKLVRQASPTITGVLTNTGRDTTVGNGAWHGFIKTDSTFTSGKPQGGTAAPWKFGIEFSGACVLDATKYIQLDVGGTLYKLSTCQ